jgi:hypothetical protein
MRQTYCLAPGSMGLALVLLELLERDYVTVGRWPGPCYADMTPEEAQAITELIHERDPSVTVRLTNSLSLP